MPALPNPFDSGAAFPPDEAAALSVPTPPGAAADIQQSAPSTEPTTAAVTSSQPVAADFLDDISNIGEIFVGARKLDDREISLSELIDRGFDAHAFMDDIEEAPLFLRQAV